MRQLELIVMVVVVVVVVVCCGERKDLRMRYAELLREDSRRAVPRGLSMGTPALGVPATKHTSTK